MPGPGGGGLAALLAAGRVRRIICSFPRSSGSVVFEELYAAGRIELELVPQGIISERMRCAAAGLGGFYSPVSVGTRLAEGKEHREIDGRMYVLEKPLKGDVALLVRRSRRPLGQSDLPQIGAQLQPDDGDGGGSLDRAGAPVSSSSASSIPR